MRTSKESGATHGQFAVVESEYPRRPKKCKFKPSLKPLVPVVSKLSALDSRLFCSKEIGGFFGTNGFKKVKFGDHREPCWSIGPLPSQMQPEDPGVRVFRGFLLPFHRKFPPFGSEWKAKMKHTDAGVAKRAARRLWFKMCATELKKVVSRPRQSVVARVSVNGTAGNKCKPSTGNVRGFLAAAWWRFRVLSLSD